MPPVREDKEDCSRTTTMGALQEGKEIGLNTNTRTGGIYSQGAGWAVGDKKLLRGERHQGRGGFCLMT